MASFLLFIYFLTSRFKGMMIKYCSDMRVKFVDIFPISLKLQQQPCLIVGGGKIAYRKAVLLSQAGAIIDVLAPDIDPALA